MGYNVILIFSLAIILRIVLLFLPGYESDMEDFTTWSSALGEHGLRSFYAMFRDRHLSFPSYALYAPVLWGIDKAHDFIAVSPAVLLKIPILFFDLASGVFVYRFLREHEERTAIAITTAYLFNPALLYAGVVWGQVDTIAAFFVFCALVFVTQKRFSFAWLALTAAVLIKPQAVLFAPLLLLITIRERKWRTIHALMPSAILFGATAVFYFGFDIVRAGSEILRTVERYPYLSVNALNIWFPFTFIADGFIPDNTTLFHFLSPRLVGILLFCFLYMMIGRFVWHRSQDRHRFQRGPANGGDFSLFLSASLFAFAGFMVLTQMHERYLYPFFLIATPLLLASRSWRIVWALLSASFLLNLFIAFPPTLETPIILLRVFVFIGMTTNIILFAWSIAFLLSSLHDQRVHRLANS